MMSLPRLAVMVPAALALSACGGSGDSAAKGEAVNSRILEGSVSDEMIPYEKLRSEPPAAKIEADEAGGEGAGQGGGTSGSTPGGEPVVPDPMQPSPAATPESAGPDAPED
jgi:hypothetical protein